MATAYHRWIGVLTLCAGIACSRSDGPVQDVRNVRDLDGKDAAPEAVDASFADTEASPNEEADLAAQWRESRMFQSGSRLRARLIDGGGDAIVLLGFRDTALDVECAYELAEDGETRCLPSSGSWVYYLDPQCTKPVWRSFPADGVCEEPSSAYAAEPLAANGDCSEAYRRRMYRLGGPLPDAPVYTFGVDGCGPINAPSCLRSVEPVEPKHFVRAETKLESVDDDLSIEWITFEDEARYIAGLVDSKREVECHVEPLLAGDRCVPSSTAHIFLDGAHGTGLQFADANCNGTQVALDFARDPCERAAIGIVWQRRDCEDYTYTLYELGAELTTAYERTELGCAAAPTSPGSWYFELGPGLDMASLPVVRRSRAGSGRLLAGYFASMAGRPLQIYGQFYDTRLERECAAELVADGTLRCTPIPDAVVDPAGPFADPTCSRPLIAIAPEPETCTREPKVAVRRAPQLGRAGAFYDVGPRFEPSAGAVYALAGGACQPRAVGPGERFYELEPQLDLAILHERLD